MGQEILVGYTDKYDFIGTFAMDVFVYACIFAVHDKFAVLLGRRVGVSELVRINFGKASQRFDRRFIFRHIYSGVTVRALNNAFYH